MKDCVALAWWTTVLPLCCLADTARDFNAARSAQIYRCSPAKQELLQNLSSAPLRVFTFNSNEWLQIEWTQPRSVQKIDLEFPEDTPPPRDLRIDWWHSAWPDQGHGGWMTLDDPFNGQWIELQALSDPPAASSPLQRSFRCSPLASAELPSAKNGGATFRKTYKLRLRASNPWSFRQLAVSTGATEERARLRFEWGVRSKLAGKSNPRFEIQNGAILDIGRASPRSALLQVEFASSTDRLNPDRGMIIFRNGETRSFSVNINDVLREGGLFVRDIGVFVSDAQKNLSYSKWTGPPGPHWQRSVEESVAQMAEQTFDNVQHAIPPKPAEHLFLGIPNARQEFANTPTGNIELWHDSLRSPGPDADRRPWSWKKLDFIISTFTGDAPSSPESRAVERHLEAGWLPIVNCSWKQGPLLVQEHCVAVPLLESLARFESKSGAEPVALVVQFELHNRGDNPAAGALRIQPSPSQPCFLNPDGTLQLNQPSDGNAHPGFKPVRAHFRYDPRHRLRLSTGAPESPTLPPRPANEPAVGSTVEFSARLLPGEHALLELVIPYIELLSPSEETALATLRFHQAHEDAAAFWGARLARGMQYEVPETWLNNFFRANLWHVLISTDMDPATGLYEHGAATHVYPNFLNETMMVATSLEMRGEFQEASRLIEPFLASQGRKGLPGNFQSKEGVFYAAYPNEPDPYTAQGYNMHHGWGLWAVASHFLWTGDEAYLRRVAPQLVKGCNWILQERKSTQRKRQDGSRPLEYGLAPAGDLEDVSEFLYYYATDAYFYLGLKTAAVALAHIGHPEAKRLNKEANLFRRDIRASVAESVATSPVVRLQDGTFIPYVPSRVYARTHLKEGWIREALYSSLHLVDGEVYPDDHPFVRWIIQDLEDNIFMSQECGFGIQNPKADFFSSGGFTLQPNLLNLPLVYLRRDEIPNFLRAFYNAAGAGFYPDAVCFAEWIPTLGRGAGPFYKTPDECKFIQWMRAMLILERDNRLELAMGAPKAWLEDGKTIRVERAATRFGSLNFTIHSHVGLRQIEAQIELAKTTPPSAIVIRLRHPLGLQITSATVNHHAAHVEGGSDLVQLPPEGSSWTVVAEY